MTKQDLKFLDFLYDVIDLAFLQNNFNFVDEFLNSCTINIEKHSTLTIVGILTATLAGRGKLKNRKAFFEAGKQQLINTNKLEPGLLDGLEE